MSNLLLSKKSAASVIILILILFITYNFGSRICNLFPKTNKTTFLF
jgi:hypothetical protein